MTIHPVAEEVTAAETLHEVLGILSDLADLQVRTSRLAKRLAAGRIVNPSTGDVDRVLKAVAAALDEQPASEETSCPQREPTALCNDRRGILQESAGKEQRDTMGVTSWGGENPTAESTSSSNRDGSADGEASSGAVPQDEAPHAGTGSETLADREGHFAKGAGEDVASAMDRHSDPAPTDARPNYERVLDLWSETKLNARGIADELGLQPSSVSVYVSRGRSLKDSRVLKGDAARAAHASATGERATGFRLPSAPPAPIKISAPIVAPRPVETPTPRPDFDPDKIIVVDVDALRAYGPAGDIPVTRPFAQALSRMADGGTYAVETLRDLGPWPAVDAMAEHFRGMRPKLAAIGVDLVAVNKFMYRVQRLGA